MANTAGLKNIKDFIAKDESGGDYEIYNFGKSGGSGIRSSTPSSKYYKADAIKLTTKTIREILVLQRSSDNPLGKGDLFAVGKYQLIPGTLYSIASKLNYLDKRYDVTTQEELGDYLVLNKRKDTGNYVNGNNSGDQKDLERAIQALGLEFASFPIITKDGKNWGNVVTGTGNKAYYGGQGPNPANSKYSVKDVVLQLIKARIQYSGKDPSFMPTYYDGSKSSSTDKVTISGKAIDSQGKPISGATIKITPTPVKLSEPVLNETTGKYVVLYFLLIS